MKVASKKKVISSTKKPKLIRSRKPTLDGVKDSNIKDGRNLKTITVREFARNMSKYLLQVSLSGQSFSVTKNGKPLADLNPIKPAETKKKKYNLQDILNLATDIDESGKRLSKTLSQEIDQIVYGI